MRMNSYFTNASRWLTSSGSGTTARSFAGSLPRFFLTSGSDDCIARLAICPNLRLTFLYPDSAQSLSFIPKAHHESRKSKLSKGRQVPSHHEDARGSDHRISPVAFDCSLLHMRQSERTTCFPSMATRSCTCGVLAEQNLQ
jgi:hypothetical protein